jgi:hypothetical protein
MSEEHEEVYEAEEIPAEEESEEEVQDEDGKERYMIAGEKLLSKVKELIHEGNVRRIIIKNEEDKVLIEIPLTFGVVGAAFFPVWAAVGAIAALVTSCSIEVERVEKAED